MDVSLGQSPRSRHTAPLSARNASFHRRTRARSLEGIQPTSFTRSLLLCQNALRPDDNAPGALPIPVLLRLLDLEPRGITATVAAYVRPSTDISTLYVKPGKRVERALLAIVEDRRWDVSGCLMGVHWSRPDYNIGSPSYTELYPFQTTTRSITFVIQLTSYHPFRVLSPTFD